MHTLIILLLLFPVQGDDEKEFMAKQTGKDKDQPDSASKDSSKSSSLAPKTEETTRSASPKHEPAERRSSGQTTLALGNPTPCKRWRGEGGRRRERWRERGGREGEREREMEREKEEEREREREREREGVE